MNMRTGRPISCPRSTSAGAQGRAQREHARAYLGESASGANSWDAHSLSQRQDAASDYDEIGVAEKPAPGQISHPRRATTNAARDTSTGSREDAPTRRNAARS